jgi:hypothetical protein
MNFVSRNRRKFFLFVVMVGWLLCGASAILAQGLASINGTVTDATGAVVPNAQVTVTQIDTGGVITVTSNANGQFVFPSLAPSHYSIKVVSDGYQNYSAPSITLQADQALTINAKLAIGAATETVTVSDETPQVDVTTGTLSQVIDQQRVNDMPLNGRNAAALTTLVAGVVAASSTNLDQGNTKTFPTVSAVSVSGTRPTQINYMLDGGNNVDEYTNVNGPFPMPDSLQEFSVQTSNYNAEYGQNAGGVVNIISKSGGSKYHGDLFEYVRNRVFNAANYFSYVDGVKTVDPLKRNQFGGTVGGPVKLPFTSWNPFHVDNAFFFFGVQRTILHDTSTSGTAILPTTNQLNGIFAGLSSPIVNPSTGTYYPYTTSGSTYTSTLPTTSYNSSSLALLNYLPSGGTQGMYNYRDPTRYVYNELLARYDQAVKSSDHLSFRYFYDVFDKEGSLDLTNLLTYSDMSNIGYHNALISETHIFNNSLINNLNVSYQIEDAKRGPSSSSIDAADLGVNIWQPSIKQINEIEVDGGTDFSVGDNPFASFRRNNYTLSDDLHWVKGRHNFSFGFHGELAKMDIDNQYRQPGLFYFTSDETGNAMASFLLGKLHLFQQASGQYYNDRYKIIGAYAQDSWKASPKLTLNYGVRYEPFLPQQEKLHRMGEFSAKAWAAGTVSEAYPNAPAGLLFYGDKGFVDGVHAVYDHVMPRFGFAYDVFGNGKLSLRGGGGIFYETRLPASENNVFAASAPFVTSISNTYSNSALGNFSDPYANITGGNPFPVTSSSWKSTTFTPQNYMSWDPDTFRTPITYTWNLAVEQQYSRSLSGRIAYVGTHSSHQAGSLDINPKWNQGSNVGERMYYSTNSVKNYSQEVSVIDTGGNISYNSLQTSLQERPIIGLSFMLNWTYSKSIDDLDWGSNEGGITADASYVMPVYEQDYKKLDRGRSDNDYRHVISGSYVWIFPKLTQGNKILQYAINDWQTNGLVTFRTGAALTAATNNGNSGTGEGRERGILNGDAYGSNACNGVTSACKPWFNPSSFSVNPSYTTNVSKSYGTIVKGSLHGPKYAEWDASLQRQFKFHDAMDVQFRAEFFNVVNHTNFSSPNTTVGSSAFGRITTANDPRIGQLSLKFDF